MNLLFWINMPAEPGLNCAHVCWTSFIVPRRCHPTSQAQSSIYCTVCPFTKTPTVAQISEQREWLKCMERSHIPIALLTGISPSWQYANHTPKRFYCVPHTSKLLIVVHCTLVIKMILHSFHWTWEKRMLGLKCAAIWKDIRNTMFKGRFASDVGRVKYNRVNHRPK